MKVKTNNDRVYVYDIMRVIAVLLVLIGHASYLSCICNYGGVLYKGYNLSALYKYVLNDLTGKIYIFHMPLFVFISGALFYKKDVNNEFENIVVRKFKRLIIPYIAYGIIYNITVKLIARFYTIKNLPYAILFETVLGKNVTQHIWFLPTLFCVTILFYIIFNILLKKDIKKLFILTCILSIFNKYIEINIPGTKFVILLLIFFCLGAIFEEKRNIIEKECENKNFLLFIIFSIITYILYLFYTAFDIMFVSNFMEVVLILSIIYAIYFLSKIISEIPKIKDNKIIGLINQYAFDIYILGDPLNYIVLFLISQLGCGYLYKTASGTIIILLIRTIGIMIFSILIAKGIKKLQNYKYFKKVICFIIIVAIIVSTFFIFYNSIKGIEINRTIYEVVNYE